MTSSTQAKYNPRLIEQAQWQMVECTAAEDLLDVLGTNPGQYTFRNLEIFFAEMPFFTFSDLHLMLEILNHEFVSHADFDKKITGWGFHHSNVLTLLLENCKFSPAAEADICKQFLQGTNHFKGFAKVMKDKAKEFLDEHPNTKFEYMYRCASNYKTHEEVIFPGHLNLMDIKGNFHDHMYFIADEIGLEAPQLSLPMDPELDHCLCEFTDISFTHHAPTTARTAAQFTDEFNTAVWDFAAAIERYGL
jgi:hypothetical protein